MVLKLKIITEIEQKHNLKINTCTLYLPFYIFTVLSLYIFSWKMYVLNSEVKSKASRKLKIKCSNFTLKFVESKFRGRLFKVYILHA